MNLAVWDGTSVDDLRSVYERSHREPWLVDTLIALAGSARTQVAATWMLKHHLDQVKSLPGASTAGVLDLLPTLETWESKLHVLQCLQYLVIPKSHERRVKAFLRQCIIDDVKFVRAWGYSGLYELARQYPTHRYEVRQLFELALRDEPASVKARIRKVSKQGF